jgi:hypothetical protein
MFGYGRADAFGSPGDDGDFTCKFVFSIRHIFLFLFGG